MTNALAVCLVSVLFLWCTNLSLARQTPKECAKGPQYWCQSIRIGSDCGAVGHCIATVWETRNDQPEANEVSNRVVHLFRELKDVRELINEEYLGARVRSMCGELPSPASKYCKENTAGLETYISHVLNSKTSAETMCKLIGVCSNEKVDASLRKKTEKEPTHKDIQLVGSNQCTWGPSYWCSNFSTVHQCKATKHCIQRVWSKMQLPEDNDSVCKICTDMVTQARDQLQSNETQEELKEVFEGSCKLIPIKFVTKQCIKLADDFVPELVETLASEMNPQQVCSVAGLCNNVAIDNALENYNTQLQLRTGCNNCQKAVTVMRKRFDATSYDAFLMSALRACGQVGSLSDSCSMLVFKYYENILEALKKDLTPASLCHLSSQCSYRFHHHDDYTFPEFKLEDVKATDDVPCEFCEQLVQHLRDVLIANTTEIEFQKVLKGLCKQSGKFADECLHLVDEYYQVIYSFLTNDLQGKEICSMIGMCNGTDAGPAVVAPLLPRELAIKPWPLGMIGDDKPKTSSAAPSSLPASPAGSVPPLPLERMLVRMPESKAGCSFCQYFLHYLQVELSDVKNEDKINEAVSKACDRLPQSVNDECKQFVTQYGPMVISLLVQEIDPSSVCPAIGLCPKLQEVRLVSINSGKSNCPLCLFAVEQLESMLKNNHTEANIRNALDGLCNHLSQKLRTECVDFVDTYTNQLVEMLVADLNAQEICVYLKLCKDTENNPVQVKEPAKGIDKFFEKPALRADRNNIRRKSFLPKHMQDNGGDIETNEIPDNTANGRPIKMVAKQKTVCVICEFVLKEIDDQITDKHNDDEIKRVVHGVCKHMPKSVKPDCDQFVEKYADLIISLLAQELQADEVCQELKLCDPDGLYKAREEILDCAVCETVVMAVRKVLSNDKVDRNIVHIIEKSCAMLPAKYSTRCHTLMEIYGDSVIHIIETLGTKGVCQKIGLCAARSVLTLRP